MAAQIEVKIPKKYLLTEELIEEFQLLNLDMRIGKGNENTLLIAESDFCFDDYEYIELKFPTLVFPDSDFDALYEINPSELNFEQPGDHSILIKMGVFDTISQITAAILNTIFNWAIPDRGRVRAETGEYEFKDESGNLKRYMSDVSYISFEKVPEEEQKKWKTRIPIPPTLSIEIVSAPKSLKATLHKMRDVWINYGTDLGVVVCPFSKKLFVFEHNKKGYKEQSIYKPFTHPLLPEFEGNFSMYVDEV